MYFLLNDVYTYFLICKSYLFIIFLVLKTPVETKLGIVLLLFV